MSFAGMRNIEQKVKEQVAGAAYRVDADLVAEAMLRHPGVRRLLGAADGDRFSRPGDARSPGQEPLRPRHG